MKKTLLVWSLFFLIFSISFSEQQDPRSSAEEEIASMTWLAGDWIPGWI